MRALPAASGVKPCDNKEFLAAECLPKTQERPAA
jgi:hypothetical protein